jgi:hypothetical protein
MKVKLTRITIGLEEQVLRWVCAEAARKQTSVSGLLGKILKERMPKEDDYESAMRRAPDRKPFPNSKAPYMSRANSHERIRPK